MTIYLNTKLRDKQIYMWQLTRFIKINQIYLLIQALYNLKQAGMLWNHEIDVLLKELNFKSLPNDSCVYIRHHIDQIDFIIIYVDDALIASTGNNKVTEIKQQLNEKFKLKEIGPLSKFLGCHLY